MNENNGLTFGPVKTYTPPNLPTLKETRNTPIPKPLPTRWKKNAAVLACLGFTGAISLTGCADLLDDRPYHNNGGTPIYTPQPTGGVLDCPDLLHGGGAGACAFYVTQLTEEEIIARMEAAELELRVHWGGSGSGPFYVAHFTEEEVLAHIRARLENAGLWLADRPPENTIWGPGDMGLRWGDHQEITIDLYDALLRVAIISLSWEESNRGFSPVNREIAGIIADEFTDRMPDMTFGVFYNPGEIVGWGPYAWAENNECNEVTPERKEEARALLIERLDAQIKAFIEWLQTEGVL